MQVTLTPTRAEVPLAAEMGFNNEAAAFFLRRLHLSHDDPQIFLREFTQNAIDAGATRIDWTVVEVNGVDKLAIVDNGEGFEKVAMAYQLKDLYSSGREQGLGKNHGIGGKTSGVAFSPAGVEYITRCAGEDYFRTATFVLNPSGNSGLAANERGNSISVLPRRSVPLQISRLEHGTMVIFHGTHPEHDTSANPGNVLGGRDWVSRYLNMRYFSFDENVRIYAATRKSKSDNKLIPVQVPAVQGVLAKHNPSPQYGTRQLKVPAIDGTVTVHWYLDHVGVDRSSSNGREQHATQCTMLFSGECYDRPRDGNGNRARLAHFGIRAISPRVSLFIEMPAAWVPNDARSHVALHGGAILPDWAAIGSSFQASMPDVLANAEREATRRACNNAKSDWRNLLEQYVSASPTWRRAKSGSAKVEIDSDGTADRPGGHKPGKHSSSDQELADTTQEQRHGGNPGEESARPTRPRPGISVPDLRFVPPGEMDDDSNAAEWRRQMNLIYVNEESEAWQALLSVARAMTVDSVDAEAVALDAARYAAGLTLAGQVVNAEMSYRQHSVAADRQVRYDEATGTAPLSVLLRPAPATAGLVRQRLIEQKRLKKTV